MNYCKFLTLLVIIGIHFISSCNSDDEKMVCLPLTVKDGSYMEEYVYNAAGKVEAILYHLDGETRKSTLEYNDKGQFTTLTIFDFNSPPILRYTYELIYDGQDKPQKRNETIWWDGVGSPGSAYRFEHDEKQRLVRAHISESPVWQRRYEYDNHDNVIKSFEITTEERLYAENLTFDNKPSLFRAVPELQTLHDYIFLYDPSKNNVLTARIHDPVNTGTDDVSYPISYNEHGFIISSLAPTPYVYGRFYFDEVTYDCK